MTDNRAPDEQHPRALLIGAAWGGLAALIWAGWMVFTRMGVQLSLNAYDIAALRFGVAGLVLLPIVLRRGISVGKAGWPGALVLATGAGAPYVIVAASGLTFASAGHAGALIPGAMPLFATLLSLALLAERLSKSQSGGLALIVGGILLIAGPGVFTGTGEEWIGHIMFLLAAFMWATFTVAMRGWGVSPLRATAIVSVVSMVLYLPIYFAFLKPQLITAPASEVLFQAFYQGVLVTVSLLSYSRAVAILGAARGSVFAALVPVLATVIAIPVLGEWPSFSDCAAILVVTLGVFCAAGARLRAVKPH